jgi:hypothetical protein
VRWDGQKVGSEAQQVLPGLPGLMRSVRTPEFSGVTFHEVRAKSVLNKVPGASSTPFRWTVNPYRGCLHQCVYCFARNTHTCLDMDAGRDFDSQVVVKVNAAEVLAGQLRSKRWGREHVAMARTPTRTNVPRVATSWCPASSKRSRIRARRCRY